MEFNCKEIVYSIVKYSSDEFKTMDMKSQLAVWKDELDNNSNACLIYEESPFENENMLSDLSDDAIDDRTVYVILYYFYSDSEYALSDDIDSSWEVVCDPILQKLNIANAIDCFTDGENEEYPECISSENSSGLMLAIFAGKECLIQGEADELFEEEL